MLKRARVKKKEKVHVPNTRTPKPWTVYGQHSKQKRKKEWREDKTKTHSWIFSKFMQRWFFFSLGFSNSRDQPPSQQYIHRCVSACIDSAIHIKIGSIWVLYTNGSQDFDLVNAQWKVIKFMPDVSFGQLNEIDIEKNGRFFAVSWCANLVRCVCFGVCGLFLFRLGSSKVRA